MKPKTTLAKPHDQNPQPVCAVMVVYHSGETVKQAITPLLPQVSHLVVIANSVDTATKEALRSIAAQYEENVTILHHGKNNLAAAQNMGIQEAMKRGYDWILLMDHDSIAEVNMVKTLLEAYHSHPKPDIVGLIAPALHDRHSCRTHKYPQLISRWRSKRIDFGEEETLHYLMGVIASGSLIPIYSFDLFGMMDESLCIDYVDKDFCLRIARGGYDIMAVRDAKLTHQLGKCHDHKIGKLHITTTNHCPERRYYIYRNRYYTWKKYGRDLPAYLIFDLGGVGYDLFRILWFESNKWEKLKAITQGIMDARRGIKGKRPRKEHCFAKVSDIRIDPRSAN